MIRAGFGYRRPWYKALIQGEARPQVLEVVPDHFFARPEALRPLAEQFVIVLHDVGCSIATPGLDPWRLQKLKEIVQISGALRFTDHLALTRSPAGLALGHLAPVPMTPIALQVCLENLMRLQEVLGIPVAVENIFQSFDSPGMPVSEFLERLLEQSGAGLLLDLTNILLEARNRNEDPVERLERFPLSRAVAVHLAGGQRGRGGWVDSHSRPVEAESYELLKYLRGRAAITDIVVEWDEALPPIQVIAAQAEEARRLWEL